MKDQTTKAYFHMLSAKEHAAHARQCLIVAIGNNAAAINLESDTYRKFTAKNISACIGYTEKAREDSEHVFKIVSGMKSDDLEWEFASNCYQAAVNAFNESIEYSMRALDLIK